MNLLRQVAVGVAILIAPLSPHARSQTSATARDGAPERQAAVNVLESVMDELREVEDIGTRAALAEDVVTLIGRQRPARCRRMLDALFDDALRRLRQRPTDQSEPKHDSETVISRIIKSAAGFDKALAERYVGEYAKATEELKNSLTPQHQTSDGAAGLYLKLAADLIEQDAALAAAVAEKSLAHGITADTLLFLAKLRNRDAGRAGRFFANALRSVEARGGADINELFLLYSYAFSTPQVPFVAAGTPALQQIPGYAGLVEGNTPDRTLAAAFLQTSVRLLLDPARAARLSAGQQPDGASGDYYFLKIVGPHVADLSPSLSAAVAARQSALASALAPGERDVPSAAGPDEPRGGAGDVGVVESLLRKADAATDARSRNRLYFKAAMSELRSRRYEAALEIVEKMSSEHRAGVRPYIAHAFAKQSVNDKRLDKAEELARDDDDAGRRAFIFTLIAEALIKEVKDFGRADKLMGEVEQIVSKLDDVERATALAGLASVCAGHDPARASRLLSEAVKVANKLEGFDGRAGVPRSFAFDGLSYFYEIYGGDLTLDAALRRQARRDFNGTLADVRQIRGRVFRLRATLALCRGILLG